MQAFSDQGCVCFCHFNFEVFSNFSFLPLPLSLSLSASVTLKHKPTLTLNDPPDNTQTDSLLENTYRGLLNYIPSMRKHQLLYDTMRISTKRTIWNLNMQITSTTKGARRKWKLPVWLAICSSVTPKAEFAIQARHSAKTKGRSAVFNSTSIVWRLRIQQMEIFRTSVTLLSLCLFHSTRSETQSMCKGKILILW